jgi:hypothetical protein
MVKMKNVVFITPLDPASWEGIQYSYPRHPIFPSLNGPDLAIKFQATNIDYCFQNPASQFYFLEMRSCCF